MLPEAITHPNLQTDAVAHGFFTRQGGVSNGIHAGLNCGFGSDDERDAVSENRSRVAKSLGVAPTDLITVHQYHSADVVVAQGSWQPDQAPRADAMVSTTPGLALGILTADCAPVLFADPEAGVVGAAHAGWRGALGGVLEATVQAMEQQGASANRISAVVGPCIAQVSYEVGAELRVQFLEQDSRFANFFVAGEREGHYQFDLSGFVMDQLNALGLARSHDMAMDTYADDQRFYSYRRSCHRDESDYGRQVAAITLLID